MNREEGDFFSEISLDQAELPDQGPSGVVTKAAARRDAFEFEFDFDPTSSADGSGELLNVFEFDEDDTDGGEDEDDEGEDDSDLEDLVISEESTPEEDLSKDFAAEIDDMIAEEDEESDVRSSGPFYF